MDMYARVLSVHVWTIILSPTTMPVTQLINLKCNAIRRLRLE